VDRESLAADQLAPIAYEIGYGHEGAVPVVIDFAREQVAAAAEHAKARTILVELAALPPK
jgi:hypothetical protein